MVSYRANAFAHGKRKMVLILVVVEDGLVRLLYARKMILMQCLNPCCSGRWSRTINLKIKKV